MLTTLFSVLDYIIYSLFACSVLYLFVFAVFSKKKRTQFYAKADEQYRFVILFPAYKEDRVIIHSVESFFKQHYPRELYDVVVISDQMQEDTNLRLAQLSAKVFEIKFEKSSKAKALNFAIDALPSSIYDIVVIMDADNIAQPDFLEYINNAYASGAMAIQAHRAAKNTNTDTALLDAASEEINNSIFRLGQQRIGLSAALSGSGMAFNYQWFAENIKQVISSGEDKEIEAILLKQKHFIEYLEYVIIEDEKIQNADAFYNQRQRWLAAQLAILRKSLTDLPKAITEKNYDYINKIAQWMLLPRVLLLGGLGVIATTVTVIDPSMSVKWWGLLFLLAVTFFVAIPNQLLNKRLLKALIKIPWLFILMFLNLFRLKGANKKFNRTEHTH